MGLPTTSRMAARISGVADWLSAKVADGQWDLDGVMAALLYVEGPTLRTSADGFEKIAIDEVQSHAVLGGKAGWKAPCYGSGEDRPAALFAVVMGAVAAGQKAQAISQLRQLRTK